jgi:hypothetical protein
MTIDLGRFKGLGDSKKYLAMTQGEQALLIDLLEASGHPVFTSDIESADTLRLLGVCEGEPGGRNYTLLPSALAYGEDLRIKPRKPRPRISGVNEYLDEV